MRSDQANIGVLTCLGLLCLGAILLIVSLATTHWLVIDGTEGDITTGLFKLCYKGHCVVYDEHSAVKITDDLHVIRGLLVIAVILYGAALVTMFLVAIQRQTIGSKTLGIVCLVLCVVGGILAIAGVGHFVRIQEDHDADKDLYKYGYSLHLAWISAVPVIIAGVLALPVVKTFFENRPATGQVIQAPPPPYAQNVAYPPAVMYPQPMGNPYAMPYDNPVMMQNMNPSQDMEKRGPPSNYSGGHSVYSGPQN